MKKINLALISDSLFSALCAFLISFTAVRFYLRSSLSALFIAIAFSLLCGSLCFAALLSKRKKLLLYTSNAREKKTLALHLSVCSENYVSKLFEKALEGTYPVGNRLEDEENAYFFKFTLSPLSPDDVADCVKYSVEKHKQIFCCEAGAESQSLAAEFGIQIKTIGEIYELLRLKNLLPEKYACGEIKKKTAWQSIKKRFNRKLCPSLFLCGLSLLFFSFFTLFKIYYIVFGGLLLTLAAVSLLFNQPNA